VALVLAGGKGWLCDDILEIPRRLGIGDDVIFTGYVTEEELLYLYNSASAVVYPSLYEGFGLPVVEAMACGAPLIISDIPSLKEVAEDAALSFQPDDHEALASLLERVLWSESLRDDLRQRGLRRAADYSWERVAAMTIAAYRRALG
jgi:glycosyltransferase involved in cell wall biosynthesis